MILCACVNDFLMILTNDRVSHMLLKLHEHVLVSSLPPKLQKDSRYPHQIVSVLYCYGHVTKVK